MIDVSKGRAIQLWPYLTEEALEDKAYWGYIQMWLSRPTPGSKPLDILSWYTRQLVRLQEEERRLKEERENRPLLKDQSLHWAHLPVNPETGNVNPQALPLTAIWFLEALLNPIIRNPKRHIADKVIISPGGEEHILKFELSMSEVRKATGRKVSFSELIQAFACLLNWTLSQYHVWEEKDKKKGWKKVVTIRGTQFIMDWDVQIVKRRGRPGKESGREDLIFSGRLAPRFSELILNNQSYHRLLEIAKIAYKMSKGAQLLYRQGLPFVLRRGGWWLTYPVACRVLGYSETPVKFQPEYIEKYLSEITTAVDWRRDKTTERLRGGVGQERIWVLKASKKEIKRLLMSHFRQEKVRAAQSH
ncbi:MAG: hypothetical protein ABFD52_05505 [Acidobacteriota bacterium]